MTDIRSRLQPWLVVFLLCAIAWFIWQRWSPSISPDTRAWMRYEATELAARFAANQHGPVHVVLVSADRPVLSIGVLFRNVDCMLPRSAMADAGKLRHGDAVRVKGRVEATGRHVVLRQCVLV